jgi:hypothetical protein
MAYLTIDTPSLPELSLAEKRDFYVTGHFSPDVTSPGDIRIDLYAGPTASGTPVRTVQSHVDPASAITPDSVLETKYSQGVDVGYYRLPDLIKDQGGLADPNNKVLVNSGNYMGLILGGATKNFDTTYAWPDGTKYQDLTAGTYTVKVTGLSGGLAGLFASEQITMGTTYIALGRFSPPEQRRNLTNYAAANNEIIRLDPLPGYFYAGQNLGYEIPNRWIPNNAIEVANDTPGTLADTVAASQNDLVVYAVSPRNATQYVEIAAMEKLGLTASPLTKFLYYDIGEPYLPYTDPASGPAALSGAYVAFPAADTLELTRAEIRPSAAGQTENRFVRQNTLETVDTNFADGLSLTQGQAFSLYGVAKPIPSTVTQGQYTDSYAVDNRISRISYNLTDLSGKTVYSGAKTVSLDRILDPAAPTSVQASIYEYKHDFSLNLAPGLYQMNLTGLDTRGAEVPGSLKTFALAVSPA